MFKTNKNPLLAIISVFSLAIVFTPAMVSADKYGYGADSWSSGDTYTVSPVYDSYYPSSNDTYTVSPVYDSYYPSYSGYSAPAYSSYSPSFGGGYSYTPQAAFSYVPTGGSGGGYVYNTNENTNANSNTNTITNTFNPTNNNDARINLVVYGGGTGTNTPAPTYSAPVYNNSQSYAQPTYQSYQSNVTLLRDQNLGTPVSGVFLSQVPATGIGFGLKMTLFTLGLTLWSIFAAFMIARKKNTSIAHKISAFKLANMAKKGIQG